MKKAPGGEKGWSSLAETPDLDRCAAATPPRDALLGADLELAALHLGLWLLSYARR